MEHWKELDFTEDDDRILKVPNGDDGGQGEQDRKAWLVGRVLTQGFFNTKSSWPLWNTYGEWRGLEIQRSKEEPFYLSTSREKKRDKDHIMKGIPWSFYMNMVVLNNEAKCGGKGKKWSLIWQYDEEGPEAIVGWIETKVEDHHGWRTHA